MCLGNISKDLSPINTTHTGLYGYIYDFSVDYRSIANDKILDIQNYLMKRTISYKMFGVLKKVLIVIAKFSVSNVSPLKCVSMDNQECTTRTKIININNNEPVFYPFSIKVSKCDGSCNNINDPYAKLCIPDVIENISV